MYKTSSNSRNSHLLLMVVFFSQMSYGSVKWIQTPYWKTAHPTEFQITSQTVTEELRSECQQFEEFVGLGQGSTSEIDKEIFESLDQSSLPSDMFNNKFKMEFTLDLGHDLLLSRDLQNSSGLSTILQQSQINDILPGFTQTPTEIQLLAPQSQIRASSKLNLMSLTQIATSIAVKMTPAEVDFNQGRRVLRVFHKSQACDFIAHRAKFGLNVKVMVKISLEEQLRLQKYYAAVSDISNDILKISKQAQIRAALFGFKISKTLNETTEPAKLEKLLIETMKLAFDIDTMEKSKIWTAAFNSSVLSVPGTSQPVDVSIEISSQSKE